MTFLCYSCLIFGRGAVWGFEGCEFSCGGGFFFFWSFGFGFFFCFLYYFNSYSEVYVNLIKSFCSFASCLPVIKIRKLK